MVKRIKNLVELLKQRGILKDTNFYAKDSKKIYKGDICGYVGFDPTAPNIHFGGATGYIGDPSGKSSQRALLNEQTLENNKQNMIINLQKISQNTIKFSNIKKDINIQFVDNKDFYKEVNVLDFYRQYGQQFNLAQMNSREIIKNRLEQNQTVSYLEYSYQLFQAIDFYHLYKKQIGGSDQWGNISSGLDLLHKNNIKDGVGITTQLLLNSAGQKFGKSENNPIWINDEQQDLLNIHQYLINQSDDMIQELFMKYTFLELPEIHEIIQQHDKNKEDKLAQLQLSKTILSQILGNKEDASKIINYKEYFKINFDDIVYQKEKLEI